MNVMKPISLGVFVAMASAVAFSADNTYQVTQIGSGNSATGEQSDPTVNGSTIIQLQIGESNQAVAMQESSTEFSTIIQRQVGSNLSANAVQMDSVLSTSIQNQFGEGVLQTRFRQIRKVIIPTFFRLDQIMIFL
ncbi:hypothetical protein QT397_09690 [Microbulbifer sp. MKSA007]|nr:hypothetical protein QT397_09690 [Microbulbifer sp. MKSA007]